MKNDLHVVLSVRLFTDQKCFGPGVAELLTLVDQTHSLRAAAQTMEMAYSKAWTILRRSEAALGFPLLTSRTGGRNGGGAALTGEARRMLDAYERYCAELRDWAAARFEETFSFYNSMPTEEPL